MYFIAILLCLGDNCDLVRPEPDIVYPSYEACSQATAGKSEALGKAAAANRKAGREGEIICLHEEQPVVELNEQHEALVATEVRPAPVGNAPPISTLPVGAKVRVSGTVAGTKWLRIVLPNGTTGYVWGERLRKLSFLPQAPAPVVRNNRPEDDPDGRRCQAIVQRAQLGEPLTDEDQEFLRRRCSRG